jgi:hypothetical protein
MVIGLMIALDMGARLSGERGGSKAPFSSPPPACGRGRGWACATSLPNSDLAVALPTPSPSREGGVSYFSSTY